MSKCFWCKEDVSRVALVNLVWTQEAFPVDGTEMSELREVVWHKECYANATSSTCDQRDCASLSDERD